MKKSKLSLLLALTLTLVTGCGNSQENSASENNQTTAPTLTDDQKMDQKAQEMLDKMTLDEKVGQLFIVRPEALAINSKGAMNLDPQAESEFVEAMNEGFKAYPVGGIALFKQNVLNPDQLKNYVSDIQKASSIPLFVSIDEEGGIVSRIANNENFDVKKYESMEAIGKTKDPNNAYEMGKTIGTYLSEYGINLDYAPDSDVNTNPENIVIGERAFGKDPQLVSDMVEAALKGFHEANVMTSIKHFPGHGDTKGDTHKGYVSIDKTWDQLKDVELIPFINNFDGADMVMVSHITAPKITTDKLPASLSKQMITDRLRTELGYDGVIITDSMEMGAIAQSYSSAESSVKAIEAGNDIILMPSDLKASFDGVKAAITSGKLNEGQINESVTRILKLKMKYGLIEY